MREYKDIWDCLTGKEAMRQPKTIAMLKATARERMIGRYGTAIGANILIIIIEFIISDLVLSMVNPTNVITFAIYLFSVILTDVIFGVFTAGCAYMYMNVIYGQPARVSDVFHGFVSHPDKAILLQIPFSLAGALETIPLTIILNYYRGGQQMAQVNMLLFLAAIGTVISIALKLVYSQVYYILQDFPDRSAGNILRTSARLMKGNKMRLFLLYLSFIPLLLVGVIALFIPLFWVRAYMESSLAAFYQDCISVAAQSQQQDV